MLTTCLQINEHYLFHRYKIKSKDSIIRDGFDLRMASDHSMLGKGIYAAESATKSDQYTGNSGKNCVFLLP